MDKLQERAIAFQKLTNYQYNIKLGRKGKLYEFIIDFQPGDFFHLIGFQYLTDLRFLKRSAEQIFQKCIKGDITYSMIENSQHFHTLGYRFECFNQLEDILDNNEIIFKFNKNTMRIYSKIEADYILKYIKDNLNFYLFIEKRKLLNNQFCKSFFENSVKDYLKGQTRMTLLYKEKINIKTKETQIQYNKLNNKTTSQCFTTITRKL